MSWTVEGQASRIQKATLAGAAVLALALFFTGCGFLGGEADITPATEQVAGTSASRPGSQTTALTNENWNLAVADPERYRGSSVDLTGQIFNVLGNYDGASHYQLFADAEGRQGNTHLAVSLEGQKLREGDFVHVLGTLEKMLVVNSRGGTELKLPYVSVSSIEAVNGVSVQTPTPLAAPQLSSSPLVTSTAGVSETTATPVPLASATATVSPIALTPTPITAGATPTPSGPFRAEFSTADLNAGMAMPWTNDATSPTGQYLSSPVSNREWNGLAPLPANGSSASVAVTVAKAGRYAVWLRMQYQNVDANSVWLVVDGQRAVLFGNDDGGYGAWRWIGWRDGNTSARVNVDLAAGQHTVTVVSREAGTRFDRVLVSDDLSLRPADPPTLPTPAASPQPPAASQGANQSTSAASPTPVAAATPTATAAASVPPSSTATATAVATATPTATPVARVSPTSTATATPVATATPTPRATATPAPSPTTAPSATPTKVASPPPSASGGSYTVQSGDTLSAIAQRLYGDASQYSRIYEANRDKLSSPDRILPGQQLRIPR